LQACCWQVTGILFPNCSSACQLRASCSCPVLHRWCQRPRDGARLSTHPVGAAGWASDACFRRCGSAAGPAAAAGTASGGGRSAPDRRGGATAALRGRVAAARRPGSGTATSRGSCPARRGPAASAIGIAAGNACRVKCSYRMLLRCCSSCWPPRLGSSYCSKPSVNRAAGSRARWHLPAPVRHSIYPPRLYSM
jgi:hypothetical protein